MGVLAGEARGSVGDKKPPSSFVPDGFWFVFMEFESILRYSVFMPTE